MQLHQVGFSFYFVDVTHAADIRSGQDSDLMVRSKTLSHCACGRVSALDVMLVLRWWPRVSVGRTARGLK